MAISLQDQLKKSGLVDDKKAKQLKRAKRKEEKQARQSKKPSVDEHKLGLEQAKAQQRAKDKQLNLEKNRAAANKAIAAQIKQLIESNEIRQGGASKLGEGTAGKEKTGEGKAAEQKKYSFADAGKVKNLWVSPAQVEQLSRGQIVIVRRGGKYALVPAVVADKIEQRDASFIVSRTEKAATVDEDDPYAAYQIPDDLDW